MTVWRLLKLKTNDAFTNMAVDEAIATARIKGLAPDTLRLYRWKPSAVSIGRFQDVSHEVQIDTSSSLGVDVVRRISGGGTVYHDFENEITYSVIAQEEAFGKRDMVQAYQAICSGLIEAAKILGVKADFNPGDPRNCPNITVNGKKISGSSQFHQGGVVLQHGTLLLDINFNRMFSLLQVPWTQSVSEIACVAQEKLTSINREIGRHVPVKEASEALTRGFEKTLKAKFSEGGLTSFEKELAEELRRSKFSTASWNLEGKYTPPKHL